MELYFRTKVFLMNSSTLLIISVVPIVLVNLWHHILLFYMYRPSTPRTISENAAKTITSLYIHRAMHTVASFILLLFGYMYLLPHGFYIPFGLLISGAIFDALEVLTLDSRSAQEIFSANSHSITAWLMALSYLGYASTILLASGTSPYIIWGIGLLFVGVFVASLLREHKDFWRTQHLYFCLLGAIIISTHLRLWVSAL